MTIPQHTLQQIINLIETRIGLSAITLSRIGLEDILQPMVSDDASTFLQTLRSSTERDPSWQRLIHALTIGETYFMRDKVHFRILRENILPRLLLERRQQGDLRLNIWCLGTSTGEEPYSIAITLYEMIPDIANWTIKLYASDVNGRAIETARKGKYREWSFRQTDDSFKQRYFTLVDEMWQIKPKVQQMVTFQQMNALSGMPASSLDIIFARHVLMYLSNSYTEKVEQVIYDALANGGWLLMGQAEALHSNRDLWAMHLFPGTPIYQKLDVTATIPEPISYPTRHQFTPMIDENDLSDSDAYQQAVQAMHTDLPDIAEQHASTVLEQHPEHAKTHILLGAILANRQQYPEALSHIESALSVSGLYADAHYIKALIQAEQNQEDNAIQSLNAAIYCQRNHALAGLMLGNIYRQRGDVIRAARNWRNALRAIKGKADTSYISDVSDMTVARLRGMIGKQQSLLDSAL